MEKQFNKISTAEMKKNMSEDTMTICECCEFLETMIGDDKNIMDCINYIERKAKSMHSKLVQNKDEIKLLKFVKDTNAFKRDGRTAVYRAWLQKKSVRLLR